MAAQDKFVTFDHYSEQRITDHVRHRLLALRRDRGLRLKDLSQVVGVSDGQYQKYEDGTSKVPFYRLLILAAFFETSIDDFIPVAELPEPSIRGMAEAGAPPLHPADRHPLDMLDELSQAFLEISNPAMKQSLLTIANELARHKV